MSMGLGSWGIYQVHTQLEMFSYTLYHDYKLENMHAISINVLCTCNMHKLAACMMSAITTVWSRVHDVYGL